jgi:hypothetical protein
MRPLALVLPLLLLVSPAHAIGDHELLAAQQELKIARDHLQAAGPDYAGHRRAAIEAVDQALREIRQGLEVSTSGGSGSTAPEHKPKRPAADMPDAD